MKILIVLIAVFSPQVLYAQDADYWELYETYAAADVAKYHDILQSIEAGDIGKAKQKILSYQGGELLVLENMRKYREISSSSVEVVKMVRQYNHEFIE